MPDHPFAGGDDVPHLLEHRNELRRHHLAERRVVPAQQGFHAPDAARQPVGLGLVMQFQFVAFNSVTQVRLENEFLDGVRLDVGGAKLTTRRAVYATATAQDVPSTPGGVWRDSHHAAGSWIAQKHATFMSVVCTGPPDGRNLTAALASVPVAS